MKVAVIGLGYVGLPLALKLAKTHQVFGYDINKDRIANLKNKIDINQESTIKSFKYIKNIEFINEESKLKNLDFYIIAVPTPIYQNKKPNLKNLISAIKLVAKNIKNRSTVIIESTVYPGVTEEICVPILKKISKLKYLDFENIGNAKGFFCGFCPERVNPGDKTHTIDKITKVISGSNKLAINKIKKLYYSVNGSNIYIAKSIKVAEAAKIIENTQRDLNIALINELSQIFKKININTRDVLDAASTKWNFMKFYPGLVGGHCIGVDPYYLTHMCKNIGFRPQVILAGRKINDYMPLYVANRFLQNLKRNKLKFSNCRILVAGLSFKENVSDIRNSKSIEIIKILKKNNLKLDIYDPLVPNEILDNQIIIKDLKKLKKNYFDAIMILVPHSIIISELLKNLNILKKSKKTIIFDIKNSLTGIKSNFTL